MKLRSWAAMLGLAALGAVSVRAQTSFTWVGGSIISGDVNLPGNWFLLSSPAGDGLTNEDVHFGNLVGSQANPLLPSSGFVLHSLFFDDTARPAYTFSGVSNPTFLLTGNINVSTVGGSVTFDSSFNVSLSAGIHTVSLNAAGSVINVASVISGTGSITKTGNGALTLTGNNTFTGGVVVNGGDLYLGSNTALGNTSSGLTLGNGTTLHVTGLRTVANALTLPSGEAALAISNSTNDSLTLNGVISGAGRLSLSGDGLLALYGNNSSWTGGLYLATGYNHVEVRHSNALGTGALLFSSSSDAQVSFFVNATLTGLASASDPSGIYINGGHTLTLNQTTDSTFAGYVSDGGSPGTFIKTGAGAVTFTGNNNGFTGSMVVNGGRLIADGSSSTINQTGSGGTLTIGASGTVVGVSTTLNNSTTSVAGRLTGDTTTFKGTTSISSGGIIAPGLTSNPIGRLTFDDLTLTGGGILEWNLQNPNSSPGIGWDTVELTSLAPGLRLGSLSAGSRFTIRVISLDAGSALGTAVGFVNQPYTWTVFDASGSSLVGTFSSTLFTIDASQFSSDIGTGSFSFANDGFGRLQLTFTPVPEPTTWALLASGAVAVVVLGRRRKIRIG